MLRSGSGTSDERRWRRAKSVAVMNASDRRKPVDVRGKPQGIESTGAISETLSALYDHLETRRVDVPAE